jgi:hypothetical protein
MMDLRAKWEKALKTTEILRPRALPLSTLEATTVPYIFLAESSVNRGDTVVRRGEVVVDRPSIVMPFGGPAFRGFDFGDDAGIEEELLKTFWLVRGVTFPSLRYENRTDSLGLFEGRLSRAIDHYRSRLEEAEDVRTGLVSGHEASWQFSVLIFTCLQISRAADDDVRRLFGGRGHAELS